MSRRYMRRLSPVDLVGAVCRRIRDGTGLDCLTDPKDRRSPYYAVLLEGSRPGKSKAMRLDVFTLSVYCVSAHADTQGPVLGMVGDAEEAMERDIDLPCGFTVVKQVDTGVQSVGSVPTGEWSAVIGYEITVSYGLIAK